jgi:hypothetical protein
MISLRRSRCSGENNIKVNIKETGREIMDWIIWLKIEVSGVK